MPLTHYQALDNELSSGSLIARHAKTTSAKLTSCSCHLPVVHCLGINKNINPPFLYRWRGRWTGHKRPTCGAAQSLGLPTATQHVGCARVSCQTRPERPRLVVSCIINIRTYGNRSRACRNKGPGFPCTARPSSPNSTRSFPADVTPCRARREIAISFYA